MIGFVAPQSTSTSNRLRQTVALLRRRGYALGPDQLGSLCLGGALPEHEVRWAVAASHDLVLAEGLVVERGAHTQASAVRARALLHGTDAPPYLEMAQRFVRVLVVAAPFVRSVSIAGSLATGGFRASDDVDLNLIVDDGHRHLAYVAVNLLGLTHAMAHRTKPVDDLTRRPIAPRLMTANLILEHTQCRPLARVDEDMAFELMVSQPVFGLGAFNEVLDANPLLLDHFPQLARKSDALMIDPPPVSRLPAWVFPAHLDDAARVFGAAGWRYMQWTRRHNPAALARVAFVRETMRPYTLFDT